ncbi:hypothetical protein [Gemmata sp.]|uniref:hypothetical protein n=1 Tax=Gemmata sp. TaxID=1914242 RepID=UPI003F724EE2
MSTLTCPHCGVALPLARDAFCPECREPLDAPPEVLPPAAAEPRPSPQAATPAEAVYWPAVALILAGGANAVVAALIATDGYTGWFVGPIDERVRWGGVVSGVASVVVIWGGYNLGRLGSFGWALAGSIIATTPGLWGAASVSPSASCAS